MTIIAMDDHGELARILAEFSPQVSSPKREAITSSVIFDGGISTPDINFKKQHALDRAVTAPKVTSKHVSHPEITITDATEKFEPTTVDHERDVKFKSRSKMISMVIDDFLTMCPSLIFEKSGKMPRIRDLVASGEKIEDVPFLIVQIDGDKARVCGHEGRHRAAGLQEAGYTHIPVILKSNVRWSEQHDPKRFDYVETWPTIMIGEKGGEIAFPFLRDESSTSYSQVSTTENLNVQKRRLPRP